MSILSKRGISSSMEFKCCDCGDIISGKEILEGEYLYILVINKENPSASTFRCECCQDELDDRN